MFSRGPMPGPFATHPSFMFTPRAVPAAETPRPSTASRAAGLSRSDLAGGLAHYPLSLAGLLVHADLPDPTPTNTPRGRGASRAAAASASPEAPFALDGCARGVVYARAASAAEHAAGEMATCEATRYSGERVGERACLRGARASPPSAERPSTAPSCEPPFAVFTDGELRGGWGAVPPRARAANQWTTARLADRRDEAGAKLWHGGAAPAGLSSGLPSTLSFTGLPSSGGPEAGCELLSVSASWMDRSARPSSRAGLRPRTASQLIFG